jgi:hypothetical protein
MSEPPLHPIEEEALRRVRANLMAAVHQHERAGRRQPRQPRRLALVGVGLAGALAAGVTAYVVADPGDHDAQVDTVGDDSQPTVVIRTTTTVDRPAPTTTTTSEAPPPPAPTDFVAVTLDGRLVVVDAEMGTELRELARLADPTKSTDDQEIAPNTITGVTVDRTNGVVYYESCCEPAAGDVRSVPLEGGEPTPITNMSWPSLSGDGTKLVGFSTQMLWLYDVASRKLLAEAEETQLFGVHTSISGDGSTIAYERGFSDDAGPHSEVVVVDTASLAPSPADQDARREVVANQRVLRDPEGIGWMHPVINRDGNVVVAQQCCFGPQLLRGTGFARVVDPATGEVVGSFSYGGRVVDQQYDASGSWLIVTLEDGRVVWFGGGGSGELATGYLAAAW